MRIEERLREAELAFLNAPFREDGWMEALERLGQATACTRFQLVGFGGPLGQALNLVSDPPSDPYGHLANPMIEPANWRLATAGRPLELAWEKHYRDYRARADTAVYDDACSDLDGHFGCQTALISDAHTMIGLVMVRSRREGPCDSEILERFARISIQAQRAVRVAMALGQEAAETMIAGRLPHSEATLLLDRYGQLLALTPAAEALLERSSCLRLVGLSLALADMAENRRFQHALSRLLAADLRSGPLLHSVTVGRSAAHPRGLWRLLLTRLGSHDPLGLDARLALTLRPLLPEVGGFSDRTAGQCIDNGETAAFSDRE